MRRNGTGPRGAGPRTGWGMGYCPPEAADGSTEDRSGSDAAGVDDSRGRGRGFGPGGGGMAFGFGRGVGGSFGRGGRGRGGNGRGGR